MKMYISTSTPSQPQMYTSSSAFINVRTYLWRDRQYILILIQHFTTNTFIEMLKVIGLTWTTSPSLQSLAAPYGTVSLCLYEKERIAKKGKKRKKLILL
jgi:hypothetical protein